jgi:hypothetical protein
VDQYLEDRQKEILWNVLANLADNGAAYAPSLARLVEDSPQSGILRLLYARTADVKALRKAAIYSNPLTLHKVVNHPEELPAINNATIIYVSNSIGTRLGDLNPAAGNEPEVNTEAPIVDADAFDNNSNQNLSSTPDAVEQTLNADISDEPVVYAEPFEAICTQNESILETPPLHDGPLEEIEEAPVVDTFNFHEQNAIPEHVDEEIVEQQAPSQVNKQTDANGPSTAAGQEDISLEEIKEEATGPNAPQIFRPANHYSPRFPKREMPQMQDTPEPVIAKQEIDDEIYDEIVGIEDIGFEAVKSHAQPTEEHFAEARFSDPAAEDADAYDEEPSPVLFHQPQPLVEPGEEHESKQQASEEEERLILGGIVNADYLRFDKKLDELRNAAPIETISTQVPSKPETPAADTQKVSRYDDDSMPYTFMWWLNKTRKEHAENLQPYAQTATNAASLPARINKPDELQHQYFENIFSLTSVNTVSRDADPKTVAFDTNKKEDVIIERFIHTEPQIKPLSADKLDNENKAKKSSEDLNDFVTETLARIYTDQMLYHKAIATYKKLMLKFPEKNLYFAARIEELEKKTN